MSTAQKLASECNFVSTTTTTINLDREKFMNYFYGVFYAHNDFCFHVCAVFIVLWFTSMSASTIVVGGSWGEVFCLLCSCLLTKALFSKGESK